MASVEVQTQRNEQPTTTTTSSTRARRKEVPLLGALLFTLGWPRTSVFSGALWQKNATPDLRRRTTVHLLIPASPSTPRNRRLSTRILTAQYHRPHTVPTDAFPAALRRAALSPIVRSITRPSLPTTPPIFPVSLLCAMHLSCGEVGIGIDKSYSVDA
jgi:hypothetical protein